MQITLKQRTAEWFQHRKKYINSTEIASIMEINPFKTRGELIKDKLFGSTFTPNKYVEYGARLEPLARKHFEETKKRPYQETIFVSDDAIFSVSLDGYNEETKTILEIKCPFASAEEGISKTWQPFLNERIIKNIPIYYYSQMQCQLYCSHAKFIYFYIYFSDEVNFEIKIYTDELFQQRMVIKTQEYLKLLNEAKQELMTTKILKQLFQK